MEDLSLKITIPDKHLSATAVKSNYSDEQKLKIAKAAKDFESLMTAMMLKSMNKTTEGMFGNSDSGGDVLDTIFESELAKQISKGKGLGIADMLYKKLTNEDMDPAIFYKEIKSFDSIRPIQTILTRFYHPKNHSKDWIISIHISIKRQRNMVLITMS